MQAQQAGVLVTLDVLIAVIKAVIALVQEVEVPGFGPAKKQAVLDLIGAIYDANPAWHAVPKETVLKLSSVAIDLIVAFFNLIGRFKHSQPAPGPGTPDAGGPPAAPSASSSAPPQSGPAAEL